ncbi:LuxR C-terminal-related transcriptional regulator [Demequina sp.]|uniref:LuxR C-terminal-related transcriptional regulator n=1 Tax=Demequina sp. TaxID=2050685 RepID=UPI003D122D45
MTGELVAARIVALSFDGKSLEARQCAADALADSSLSSIDRARIVAASAFTDYIDARFVSAIVAAQRAQLLTDESGLPADPLVLAVLALASANDVTAGDHAAMFREALASAPGTPEVGAPLGWLALAVLVEAALAHGELGTAAQLIAERDRREPPAYGTSFATLQSVRIAIFGGDLDSARRDCEAVIALPANADRPVALGLARAFLALIAAYQGDAAAVDRELESVAELVPQPAGCVDGGSYIVAGFALAALGRYGDAAPWILRGGGGPDLHLAQVVDRALGYDILVAAALAEGDAATAELWLRRAHALDPVPSAVLAVEQTEARLALARGSARASQERAELAADRARAAGRLLEAANADLARALAMTAAGDVPSAIDTFTATAHNAEVAGALALRQRATSELRRLGRRLEPRRGAGAAALSVRELEVATLAAEGFTSRQIARSLFISERTVQTHLRRVMRALGVTARSALPSALGDVAPPHGHAVPLTGRQREVAQLVREGLTNAEIAATLGISVKTVEKHVALIFDRWGVSSRTGIARFVPFAENPAHVVAAE